MPTKKIARSRVKIVGFFEHPKLMTGQLFQFSKPLVQKLRGVWSEEFYEKKNALYAKHFSGNKYQYDAYYKALSELEIEYKPKNSVIRSPYLVSLAFLDFESDMSYNLFLSDENGIPLSSSLQSFYFPRDYTPFQFFEKRGLRLTVDYKNMRHLKLCPKLKDLVKERE